MKAIILIYSLIIFINIYPQEKASRTDKTLEVDLFGVEDRALGIHNAGNVGLSFENRGKLYPRYVTQGPSGEFPISSTKNYIYRINPIIGKPWNVIQSRYTINEEWEAVGGYHNPALYKIAFSDDPLTWHPVNGWPVKDSSGNPIFISDQDSYCVYSDSNNSVSLLDLFIHQTGYVFASDSAEDIIFFKYQVINSSQTNYDSLYFSLYCDIDIGDVSGGVPEYADDRVGFDKDNHFLYFYDDGYTPEWPDSITGYFGVVFLGTPQTTQFQSGITDFHYNLYDDDVDNDTVQFGIISSSEGLYNSNIGYKYFHPGTIGNIHFDDTLTVPLSGLDVVANISSGPYSLSSNQSLIFYTAIIGGNDYNDIYQNMLISKNVFNSFITSIEELNEFHLPIVYQLSQNFPNPFNSSSVIKYSIPKTSQVSLKIFNTLAEEIETLVNEEKAVGTYEVSWNAANLPSGVYFYRLQAGSFVQTRKMILLK